MKNQYDAKYGKDEYYWGTKASPICNEVPKLLPPDKSIRVLDIGCGEGRNAVHFAKLGYSVTAFDKSEFGVRKTEKLARKHGVSVDCFIADINEYQLNESYDILFSTGVLQYVPEVLREKRFINYQEWTKENGLNVFSVFVSKPFIDKAPDAEKTAYSWKSGEMFTLYRDWKMEFITEEIFDCMSSGIPHKHAVNRMIARNVVCQPVGGADAVR